MVVAATPALRQKQVLLVPGKVKKGERFSVRFVTEDGRPRQICLMPDAGAALTTVRSPSGTGKSTLIERFVRLLRDRQSGEAGDLGFSSVAGTQTPPTLAIGVVPQNPPFVRHWVVGRLLPPDAWSGRAVFGVEQWGNISKRLLGQLSGGQMRRIYACSALESLHLSQGDASILVLDETLDGLNPIGAGSFVDKIVEAWAQNDGRPLSILLVTHLPALASTTPEAIRLTLQSVNESSEQLDVKVEVSP